MPGTHLFKLRGYDIQEILHGKNKKNQKNQTLSVSSNCCLILSSALLIPF